MSADCLQVEGHANWDEPCCIGRMDRTNGTSPGCSITFCACSESTELVAGLSFSRCEIFLSHTAGCYQCLSSISEFPELVATIQTMRSINPLQVRPFLTLGLSVPDYFTRCAVLFVTINTKSTREG